MTGRPPRLGAFGNSNDIGPPIFLRFQEIGDGRGNGCQRLGQILGLMRSGSSIESSGTGVRYRRQTGVPQPPGKGQGVEGASRLAVTRPVIAGGLPKFAGKPQDSEASDFFPLRNLRHATIGTNAANAIVTARSENSGMGMLAHESDVPGVGLGPL